MESVRKKISNIRLTALKKYATLSVVIFFIVVSVICSLIPFVYAGTLLFLTCSILCATLSKVHKERDNLAASIGYSFVSLAFLRLTILRALNERIGVFSHVNIDFTFYGDKLANSRSAFLFGLFAAIGFLLIYIQKLKDPRD